MELEILEGKKSGNDWWTDWWASYNHCPHAEIGKPDMCVISPDGLVPPYRSSRGVLCKARTKWQIRDCCGWLKANAQSAKKPH